MTEHDDVHVDEAEAAEAGDYAPPKAPYPKVQAVGIAGALTVVLVWGAGLFDVELPPEVASAFTLLLGLVAGYLRTE